MKIDFWEIVKNTFIILWQLWPIWVILLSILGIRLFFDWLDLEIDNWRIHRKFKKERHGDLIGISYSGCEE